MTSTCPSRPVELRRAACAHFGSVGQIASPPDDAAHRRGFPGQSVLRAGAGPCGGRRNHRPRSRSCHVRSLRWCAPGSAISTTKSVTCCWLRRVHRSDRGPAGPGQWYHRQRKRSSLLEKAESKGIVGIEGNRVRFTHPLLARGVYTDARPSRRRKMHRALAKAEAIPEVRARHLALAATSVIRQPLEALDAAAEAARARGAPSAAAELVELAIGLGGDTPGSVGSARPETISTPATSDTPRSILEPRMRELQPAHSEQPRSP